SQIFASSLTKNGSSSQSTCLKNSSTKSGIFFISWSELNSMNSLHSLAGRRPGPPLYPGFMKQLALRALDSALMQGVTYADVRVIESRDRDLSTKNGKPGQVSSA